MEHTSTQHERYAYQRLIGHLATAGHTARLFKLVDERGFLAAQADHFHDFGRTSEDVESFLLPAVIAAEDWTRFVQYAAIALNLRGLAEDLAEPEILGALARSGQGNLAHDAASRITDPLRRAAARAVLADEQRDQEEIFGQMLETIEHDLEVPLIPPAGGEEIRRRTDLLADMARRLGVDCHAGWPVWIDKAGLSAEQAPPVWRAAAEAWLDRGDPEAPGLWEALARLTKPEELLAFLPMRLATLAVENAETLLDRLQGMFSIGGDQHRATLSFLARLSGVRPETAIILWERWIDSDDVPWTAELIEVGKALFAKLEPWRLETFLAGLSEPVTAAALRVVTLEAEHSQDNGWKALEAVEKIPDGAEKLHWALRYLRACAIEMSDETRNQVAAVGRHLHDLRYNAQPQDLRRYLDLVARFFPERLADQMESLALSPTCRGTTLLGIACEAEQPEVAEELLKNVPSYIKWVSTSEPEYFRLRRDLLLRSAGRACTLRGAFPEDLPSLLQEEEEELSAALAPALALQTEDGLRISDKIRDRRLKLLTRLRIARSRHVKVDLDLPSLYASLARNPALDDELLAITCLLTPFSDPAALLKQAYALRVPSHRVLTLLHIGWRLLRHEAARFAQRWNPSEVIDVIRSEIMIEGNEALALLLPELAAFGAQVGGKRAVAEVCDAVELTVTLTTVSWPRRLKTIDRILANLPAIFRPLNRFSEGEAPQYAHDALVQIALLPVALEPGLALDQLSEHWHEVLPIVAAAGDRLPEALNVSVRHAMSQGLSIKCSGRATVADRIYSSCMAEPMNRARTARRLLRQDEPAPSELCALAYLLARPFPALAAALVERLPETSSREILALQMVRNEWFSPSRMGSLVEHAGAQARTELDVWSSAHLPDPGPFWVRSFAQMVSQGRVAATDDPDSAVLVRRLWTTWPALSRLEIASALPHALHSGGRQRGEALLCFWFHAHLGLKIEGSFDEETPRPQEIQAALSTSLVQELRQRGSSERAREPEDQQLRDYAVYAEMKSGSRSGETAFWRNWSRSEWMMGIYALGIIYYLILLEPTIWWQESFVIVGPRQWPPPIPRSFVTISLLVAFVLPVKGWLTNSYLARQTPFDRERPAWIKLLRGLMGSVPSGGHLAISWWKWVLARAPSWADPRSRPSMRLDLRAHSRRLPKTAFHYPGTSNLSIAVALLSFLPFYVLPFAITSPSVELNKRTMAFLCAGLHILLFICVRIEARQAMRRNHRHPWTKILFQLSSFSCLLPVPLCALGFFALSRSSSVEQTFVRSAHDSRTSSEKLTFRLRRRLESLEQAVPWLKRWKYPTSSSTSDYLRNADTERASLRRLKTLLLAPEAALVAGLMIQAGVSPIPSERLVIQLFYTSMACAVGFFLFQFVAPVTRLLRLRRISAAVATMTGGGYLFLTPAVLLAGVGGGVLTAEGKLTHLGLVLLFGGSLANTLFCFSSMIFFSRPSYQRPFRWLWSALLTAIMILGVTIIANPEHAARWLVLVFMAPPASLVAGLALSPSLLRPFTWRHIVNRRFPIHLRTLLSVFTLTAILPLGGLAVPFWIWARHRLWPRYERFAELE